jgi:hypothetical protein
MTTTDTNILNHSGELHGVYIGRNTSGDKDITAQQDSTPKNPLGCVTRFAGNLYRYVYFVSGTTVAGAPAYWQALNPLSTSSTASFAVTQAAASAIDGKGNNVVAGVFLAAAITAARYIWVQVGGVYSAARVGASTAMGDLQFGGSNDIFVRIAQGQPVTDEPFGIALAGISSNVAAMEIINCNW